MATHTPDTLLKLLQIMWSKQELIGKAVGAPLGFQMSKEFIEKLEEEPQASVSEFLFLVCAPWARSNGCKSRTRPDSGKCIAEQQGCPSRGGI